MLLPESKEKFLNLLDEIVGPLKYSGIILLDDQFRVIWVNRAIEYLIGIRRKDVIGRDNRQLIHDWCTILEEPEKFEHTVLSSYSDNTCIERFECHVLPGTSREEHFLEYWSVPILTGTFAGCRIEYFYDITAQKRVEQRLATQEGYLHHVFDNMLDGILIIDYDGKILKYNSVLAEMLNVGPDEIIGRNITEFLAPDYRASLRRAIQNVRMGQGCMDIYRILSRHKCEFWFEFKLTGMVYNEKDVVLVFIRDITALKEKSEFLEHIIDNIPDTIMIKDSKHRVVMVNRAYCEITGQQREDVIGKKIYRKTDEMVINKGGVVNIPELTYTDLNGNRHYVSVKKAPLVSNAGEVTHVLTVSHDITELKNKREELAAKNKELEQFTYTVSHDLKAPLLTIQGFVQLLRDDLARNDHDAVDKDLKYIENAAKKMEKLINDTLQLSRIGRVMNPPEDVAFHDIVVEALEQTRQQIESRGVEVSVSDDLPVVRVDRMKMVEVMVNLITNSVKYMGNQKQPKIEIGYMLKDGEVVLFVRDNGIGIEKNQHEKVFELFYKLDSRSDGTGAGLAIVKRIIEVHGGRIWIESKPGHGCTVFFTLPLSSKSIVS